MVLEAGRARIHPMAFAYPARDRTKLVVPTVLGDRHVYKRQMAGRLRNEDVIVAAV